ncbi:MAG: hypothetical protein LBU30_05540 [Candidatus Methanoplasma sp.]|nr:hypothetical protein [Candidatus Methanoplasma sp.]
MRIWCIPCVNALGYAVTAPAGSGPESMRSPSPLSMKAPIKIISELSLTVS